MILRNGMVLLLAPLLVACTAERETPDPGEWMRATQQRIAAGTHLPVDPQNSDKPRSGIVVVRVSVHESGRIYTPLVARSSGDGLLDSAALVAVLSANPLSPPPLPRGKRFAQVLLPVIYSPTPESAVEMEAQVADILRQMRRAENVGAEE